MQLLKWLRQEGVLPRDLVYQLEDAEESLADFSRLQRVLKEHPTLEDVVLECLARRYQLPLLPREVDQLWSISRSEQEALFHESLLLLVGNEGIPWLALTALADWRRLPRLQFQYPGLRLGLVNRVRLAQLYREGRGDAPTMEEVEVSQQWQELFNVALRYGASDIHLEPGQQPDQLLGRLRIDGELQTLPELSSLLSSQLLPHLKLQAGLDIAVRRRPQDGYLQQRTPDGQLYDLRLSSLPTEQGEKLVLRLLESGDLRLDLAQLGFYEDDRAVLKTVMRRQYGMLLVVGPTGSGKTTTLYALLNQLDAQRKNVITIEDPVEYHLPSLTQVSVQPAQGLGFAEALRATLRQDSDVILVVEIRDEETAQIAFKAALTGHLVLATLHTNNTLSCLQRLENLGVERALIADTLLLVLSQRLVRSAVGGRLPVYELLRLDETLQDRLRRQLATDELLAPYPGLYFRSIAQTAERMLHDHLVRKEELEPILPIDSESQQ